MQLPNDQTLICDFCTSGDSLSALARESTEQARQMAEMATAALADQSS